MTSHNRTLICLAAKRSGTTAIHRIFAKHPQVQIVHPDQQVKNNEPNFWNFAAAALKDHEQIVENDVTAYDRFVDQMTVIAPHISIPQTLTEQIIFDLWDQIAESYGNIVFDKSPRYLEFDETLELLKRYKDAGNDVRFFGIMRAPWDTISSQFELWEHTFAPGTPEFRDAQWVAYYKRFEKLQAYYGHDQVPLFYYERVANNPAQYIPELCDHCGIEHIPETYNHFRPVSIGRYYKTQHPRLRAWKPSQELLDFAEKHGYQILPFIERVQIRTQMLVKQFYKFGQRVYYKIRSTLAT